VLEIFFHFKCFEQYSKKSNDLAFMYSLIHTSDKSKRLGYVNPNLINQIELKPQINENNLKYKNMRLERKMAVKKTHQ
jgi:hypothetical protein